MAIDLETLKSLLNNPLNLLAIVGISYILNEVRSISHIKDKVTKYEYEITNIRKEVEELKKTLERLDNEHRDYTRKGGRHH